MRMKPDLRLRLAAVAIMLSAAYGVLVVKDRDLANDVMLGYVGVLLTIFTLSEVWQKHDR